MSGILIEILIYKKYFVFEDGGIIYNKLKYIKTDSLRESARAKKTGPWNGHSSVIFPSLKPDGISKDGTNIICTS